MSYLDRIQACNNFNPDEFLPFYADQIQIGWMRPEFINALIQWPEVFKVSNHQIHLHPSLTTFESRSQAIDQVNNGLKNQGIIEKRAIEEAYGVTTNNDRSSALFTLDRAAAAHYGIRAFGQHINGFVRTNKGLNMWVAVRALDKPNEPGKWDQVVAGGLPHTLSMKENLAKECAEEADIPPQMAQQAIFCGEISYRAQTPQGAKPDTMYCYDLELPANFTPRCTDGEVDSFKLLCVEEVADWVKNTDQFKLNCNLVIIDFLIRHGYLDASEPSFMEIQKKLHQ